MTEESHGWVEGILVEIEQGTEERKESPEVCLADEKGEELDLIVWEEGIKGEESAQSFRILMAEQSPTRDQAVQTEWSAGQGFATLMMEFPNFQLGGGVLPDPKDTSMKQEDLEPLE